MEKRIVGKGARLQRDLESWIDLRGAPADLRALRLAKVAIVANDLGLHHAWIECASRTCAGRLSGRARVSRELSVTVCSKHTGRQFKGNN